MEKQIEAHISEELTSEIRTAALEFVEYLRKNSLTFYRDTCDCWKDKLYYWVKRGDECLCFIAINDPDEPENDWTVWSDDSHAYENSAVADEIKDIGWRHIDHCGNCGSCRGGKEKIIFGKKFPKVCGCTFRIDNAMLADLPFLKALIDLRLKA